MIVLADYNLNRHAVLLSGSLLAGGWLDIVPIRILNFQDVNLPSDADDRRVWQFAQSNQMLLITANRNSKGSDSLEAVMREENSPTSLPIVTISVADRINEYDYRERCVQRLVEIIIDIQDYLGAGRLFIP
jgi:hypothetical protein